MRGMAFWKLPDTLIKKAGGRLVASVIKCSIEMKFAIFTSQAEGSGFVHKS